MTADPQPRKFPGWQVVGAAFMLTMVSSGLAFYGLSVYLTAFVNQRGFRVSAFSLATTIFFAVGGFSGVLAARLVARFEPKVVASVGTVVAGISLGLVGRATEAWQVYIIFIPLAVGWAMSGLVPVTTVVTRWFHAKRAVALSIASTGLSVGGVVITPVVKRLLDQYDMRIVTPWLGVVWIVIGVPIAMLFLHRDPALKGWLPDGVEELPDAAPTQVAGESFDTAKSSHFFKWATAAYVLLMASQVGGLQQLVRLVEERTSKSTASATTLIVAITSVVARLVGGQVAAKVRLTGYASTLGFLQGLGLVALAFANQRVTIFAALVFFGITVGNLLMLQPLLIAQRFGVREYARLYSRMNLITTMGIAAGPFLLGWLRDNAGGYRTAYLVSAGLSIVGAATLRHSGPAEVDAATRGPGIDAATTEVAT